MIHLFVNNNDHESPERRGDRKETDDKQEKVNFRQFAKQISIATYLLTYNNNVTTILNMYLPCSNKTEKPFSLEGNVSRV